jgi:formylglycine-generating enzyme
VCHYWLQSIFVVFAIINSFLIQPDFSTKKCFSKLALFVSLHADHISTLSLQGDIMTNPRLLSAFAFLTLFLLCLSSPASQPVMTLVPDEAEPGQQRLIWSTDPGIRYELQETDDISDPDSWSTVAGYPSEAEALAQQALIELDAPDQKFFRVAMLDEQPPVIARRRPGDGSFGIGRFSTITAALEDFTGVDPDSIELTVGDHGTFMLNNPELDFEDGILTFWLGGDTALGMPDTTQTISLVAGDILGNTATNTWSFQLERDAQAVENLFVFGSPNAQRAGQRLRGVAASIAVQMNGPIRMSDSGYDWNIEAITSNTVVLAYTDSGIPEFSDGQFLANLTPTHVDEIFYRRIVSVEDDPASQLLTLFTSAMMLTEVLTNASFSLSDEFLLLEIDEDGYIIRASSDGSPLRLPSLGGDFSNQTLFQSGPLRFELDEAKFLFHPYLNASIEWSGIFVDKFWAEAAGDLEIACVPRVILTGSYNDTINQNLYTWTHGFWGAIAGVPIYVSLDVSVSAQASVVIGGSAEMTAGFRQNANMGLSVDYDRSLTPRTEWDRWFRPAPFDQVPFTYTLNGQGQATLALVPQIDIKLYEAAGVYMNVDPRLEVNGSATMVGGSVIEADWSLGAYADLNAGLDIILVSKDNLPSLPPVRLFTREWSVQQVYEPPPPAPPVITRQPRNQSAKVGDSVTFSVDATGSGSLSYQWYHNGQWIPGATSRQLTLRNINTGHQGGYRVRVTAAGLSTDSASATLSVTTDPGTGPIDVPSGMVLISAGNFQMGDHFSEGSTAERPVHTVYVSAFFMDRYEVTKALWDQVYTWAVGNGYSFDNAGSGKAANHPVHTINWYDMVKWCNARSEMEGRTPAYYTSSSRTSANIYRTGRVDVQNDWVRWDAGYRLPTEAEWEKAARGGQSGRRFPWGDTIQHSRANYYSSSSYSYDTSPTRGYHPTYNTGGMPYTSPVGSFAANGYGLYDMAGNVWEWTWDWLNSSEYNRGSVSDPRGPATGSDRVVRGGSWNDGAPYCRVARRFDSYPAYANGSVGFRVVLHPGQ